VICREFLGEFSKYLFEGLAKTDLYVEGASNILKFPEFHDYETMRHFAELVDEKQALGEVLTRELKSQGLQVKIGIESSPELKNFSVVSSSYEINGRRVGVLGILGPKRMEYERMMSIVNTVAQLVNRMLGDKPRE
jgi:heat-inducible transcriptional repressor